MVLLRALNGERQADIAKDIGVHQTALSQALLKHCEEEWKDVQVARAWANVEDAEQELEIAPDMTTIARARERLKSAQWQLERLHRRLFGQEAPAHLGSGTVHINIGINRGTPDVHVVDSIDVTPDAQSGKGEK
jgi:transposase-like protein